jgi:DNA-binding NarL/FixJ family response regulator
MVSIDEAASGEEALDKTWDNDYDRKQLPCRETGVRPRERWRQGAHEKLSTREYQVMRMIATGKPPREISGELSLSVRTINVYRSRILHKMNMKSNAELTHYAIQYSLPG